jgi:hypothetical protein
VGRIVEGECRPHGDTHPSTVRYGALGAMVNGDGAAQALKTLRS